MLDEDEGRAGIRRQILEQCILCLKATIRGANTNNWKVDTSVDLSLMSHGTGLFASFLGCTGSDNASS